MFLVKEIGRSLIKCTIRYILGRRSYADYSKTISNLAINKNTKVLVQGFTRKDATYHSKLAIDHGTLVVGGVSSHKGGSMHLNKPIFSTVDEAIKYTGANATVIFVPAPYAMDAVEEAIGAEIPLIVLVTEGIPDKDMVRINRMLHSQERSRLLGPNSPGIIGPGKCKIGVMPGSIHTPGKVAIISRSNALTYPALQQTTLTGLGQSFCIGLGGDALKGTGFVDCLKLSLSDPRTKGIVLLGEIDGSAEEKAADFLKEFNKGRHAKPVVSYIGGTLGRRTKSGAVLPTLPAGKGAKKLDALRRAGVIVAQMPNNIGALMSAAFKHQNIKAEWHRGMPMYS